MKYNKGDKFLIEIESRLANEQVGLYKVKGFNTLVFDDYGLDVLKQVHDRLPCGDCEYEEVPFGQEPCEVCCHHHESKFKPKTEEIQVGDEVEYDGEFGIVIHRGDTYCSVLDRDLDRRTWGVHSCTRTGRTYPDLIKALAQLPKEGE